jgi:predicted RND superfamily exporter protein
VKHSVIRLATRRPGRVYLGVLLLTCLLGLQIPRIHVDTDPENMLPADQTDRAFHNLVEGQFTLHDAIVVGVVNEEHSQGIYNPGSLGTLHWLSKEILTLDGVVAADLMSLSEADNITQAGAGAIRFEWLMRDAPATREAAEAIREQVARLPLLNNTLVSGDGRAAAIYVPITSKDLSYEIAQQIRDLTAELAGDDQIHITGLPVAEDTFGYQMFVQMGLSAPLAALMIFLLMWYFFRSVRLVVAPMLVAMATVVAIMGLLIGLGFTVHIMSSMIPIFLMPIAVVDSVHIMSEFADRYRPGSDAKVVIAEVVDTLFTPMLFTSITTAVGFASLLLTPIPPVQIFGFFVAFGVLLAFLITIVLVPAYVVRMKPAALTALANLGHDAEAGVNTPLARGLRAIGRFALRRGKLVTAIALVLIGVSVAGVMRIQINDNPVRWFKASHPIRVADQVLNEHFAGTYDAFLVLTAADDGSIEEFRASARRLLASARAAGAATDSLEALIGSPAADALAYYDPLVAAVDDAAFAAPPAAEDALLELLRLTEEAQSRSKYFQRPEALAYIAGLQRMLGETGWVGKTNALPDVVKVVNRELRGGSAEHYVMPDSVPGVAQTLLQFQSSHRPQDLWHMVTPDYRSTAIWLQLTSGDNQDMTRVVDAVAAYVADNPPPDNVQVRWAGKTYINVIWQDAMVSGMLKSLLGAFVIVFLMMTLLFRSPGFGLLAMVPLSATIVGVYGVIGWVGKDYDMPIAVLSALTLGLSVDFAIHFIQRLRSLYAKTGSFAAAAEEVFEEPARAIARNGIVIALGFTPLFVAPLVPYITVGAFMAAIMAVSGLATLVLLPAILSWAHPWLFKTSSIASQEPQTLEVRS